MGRPLNKKYFGNRNTGSTSVTTDDGIGGGAVASVTLDALGSYTTRPTITFANTPKLPGGVRATGTVTSEILSVVFSGTMTGYEAQDEIYFGDAVITIDIGGVDGGSITAATVTTRGSFTTLASGAQATTTDGAGTGALITVTYRAKAVVITEAGSGYTAAPAATFTQSVTATSVNMLVDSGSVGSVTNQENAIQMVAFLTGGSAVAVDIIRQVSTTRYKVTDGTLTGIVALQTTEANAAGEGSIVATDSADGTYYVTKLTAHKATVTRGTGTQFDTGSAVAWTFNAATENATVKIANA